jgi:hypothetical protein
LIFFTSLIVVTWAPSFPHINVLAKDPTITMLLSTYLSLIFIENFHVLKTMFQLLHFSIFLHAQNNISNINFHALKISCEHWGLSPKNKTPPKKNTRIN